MFDIFLLNCKFYLIGIIEEFIMADERKKGSKSDYRKKLQKKLENSLSSTSVSVISQSNRKTNKNKSKKSSKKTLKISLSVLSIAILLSAGYFAYSDFIDHDSTNTVSSQSVISKPNNVTSYTPQQLIDLDDQKYNQNSHYSKISPDIDGLTNVQINNLRLVLKDHDISENIRKKASNPNVDVNDLYNYKYGKLKVLDDQDANMVKNGYNTGRAFSINKYGVVDNIIPYSSPWRAGLKKYDKIVGFNGNKVNLLAGPTNIENAIFSTQYSQLNWYRGSSNIYFNTGAFSEDPLYGQIAEISVLGQDTLILKIHKFTNYTPYIVYQLLLSQFSSKIKGMIIDLSNTSDYSYFGIPQLVWLFNGQKNVPIAQITDNFGKTSILYSSKVNFDFDPNFLNSINKIPKIIQVNYGTSGSPEILAKSIKGILNGTKTQNDSEKINYYDIGGRIASLSNYIVKDKDGHDVSVTPKINKVLNF